MGVARGARLVGSAGRRRRGLLTRLSPRVWGGTPRAQRGPPPCRPSTCRGYTGRRHEIIFTRLSPRVWGGIAIRYHKATGLQGRHKATGLQGRGRAKTSYVLLVAFRRLAVCSAEAGAGFHPHTEPRSTQSCVEQRNITYNGAGRQRSFLSRLSPRGWGLPQTS